MCTRDENLAFDLKSEDNNPELTPNLKCSPSGHLKMFIWYFFLASFKSLYDNSRFVFILSPCIFIVRRCKMYRLLNRHNEIN